MVDSQATVRGKSNLGCCVSPNDRLPQNKLAEGLTWEHFCMCLLSVQGARVRTAMGSLRVWGCPHKGSPALAQGWGRGARKRQGRGIGDTFPRSDPRPQYHRCYQFPSTCHFIKSLGWWAREPQSVESLFVLLLWEGVRKAADLGSVRLSGLHGAKVL